MSPAKRQTRYSQTSAQARRMLALGESGKYEFKSDLKGVHPALLCTMANWVAITPDVDAAHLLIGVEEVEDPETGLVWGRPCGLPRGLDHAVELIQNHARETRPIPVDIFIVEEAVKQATPFVRVEVRPSMPPHFDAEGRRQTRIGRSTRALTDDELLRIYLDREAGSFAARFRTTAVELQQAVGVVGTQVDQITKAIETNLADPVRDLVVATRHAREVGSTAAVAASAAASAASSAEDSAMFAASSADSVGDDVRRLDDLVHQLFDTVDDVRLNTPDLLPGQVVKARRKVWWNFTVDTWERKSALAERLTQRLSGLLSQEISFDASRNAWELRVWADVLTSRGLEPGKGTLTWWRQTLHDVDSYLESPSYAAPEIPDLRTELRADLDQALDDPDSRTNRFASLVDDDQVGEG